MPFQARCHRDESLSKRVRSHISNTVELTGGLEVPPDLDLRFVSGFALRGAARFA